MKSVLSAVILIGLSLNAHAQVGAAVKTIITGAEKPALTAVGTAVKADFILKTWPKNSLIVTAEKLPGSKIKSLSFRVAKADSNYYAEYDREIAEAVKILEKKLVRNFRVVSTYLDEDGARVFRVEFPPLGVSRATLNKALAEVESKLAEGGHEVSAHTTVRNINIQTASGSR
jgi:hypothetical protein